MKNFLVAIAILLALATAFSAIGSREKETHVPLGMHNISRTKGGNPDENLH